MLIRKLNSNSIQIETPAKVNLFLDVLGRRPDGYHEISTVMCPISLFDEIEVARRDDSRIELKVSLPTAESSDPAWKIPVDEHNLCYRAARLVCQHTDDSKGFDIWLKKKIPSSAGLGGGSGNAAAVVVACLVLQAQWNWEKASELCAQLGSDVNFFLGTKAGIGLIHATGRGEIVQALESQPALRLWLLHPPEGCSTQSVYSKVTSFSNLKKTQDFLASCQTGQEPKIGASMFNALQLPATQVCAWINKQLELLADCGCNYRQMSGSGSSCFGFAPGKSVSFEQLVLQAKRIGINRVYEVDAWYGQSIDRQLTMLAD